MTLGATPFSIYLTFPPDQIALPGRRRGLRAWRSSSRRSSALLEARAELPALEHVIVVDGDGPRARRRSATSSGSDPELRRRGRRRRGRARRPADADLHVGHDRARRRASSSRTATCMALVALGRGDDRASRVGARVISWLPAAHIAERDAHHYIPVVYAGTITCCPDPREILDYLPQVRPTWFFAVPRIWEKLKAGLGGDAGGPPGGAAREPVEEALAASLEQVRLEPARRAGARPSSTAAVAQADAETVLDAARRCSGSTRRSRSTSAPRRRRSRCSSSSTRSGSSWPSCGGCRRRAASGTLQPRRSGAGSGTVGPAAPGRRAQARRRRRAARAAATS